MNHRVSELSGVLLDAAVAKAEGVKVRWDVDHDLCVCYEGGDDTGLKERRGPMYRPSIDWAQGGPLVQRHWTEICNYMSEHWDRKWLGVWFESGDDYLLREFMRGVVASKFGDEVGLPESND